MKIGKASSNEQWNGKFKNVILVQSSIKRTVSFTKKRYMDRKSKYRLSILLMVPYKGFHCCLRLDSLVEGTGDNILLLLGSKLDEVYCITGHADGQLRIVLRMFLSIPKHISL